MKKKALSIAFLILCVIICGVGFCIQKATHEVVEDNSEQECLLETVEVHETRDAAFIQVVGEELLDGDGESFRIKGMCFGNNVWANKSEPTLTHHDASSYQELAELGFNTVRFYMNYRLFEDDENPYVYKESGFEWLNQNIEWARENNIKLILNLHVPQGGFISASKINFWKNEENIKRYKALWYEIAKRYADESVILGYGLMNEPFLPKLETEEESLNLYYDLMENLTATIRQTDQNHIFFIERPYGLVDEKNRANYAWGDTGSFRLLSDENVVYEFHFYEYTRFTSQGISWSSFEKDWYYGDDSVALLSGERKYFAISKEKSVEDYDMSVGGWQYLESPKYELVDYSEANAAYFLLYFSGLSKDTEVLIDEIVVKEYSQSNQFIRTIYEYSFDNTTACSGWDLGEGTGGKCTYIDTDGHDSLGAEQITEAGGNYRLYKNESLYNYFPIQDGNKYQVGLWVKVGGDTAITVEPGLQLISSEKVYVLNKEFLEDKLLVYVELGKQNQIPIYIGEFGTTSHIMGNEYGGEEWVEDVLDIFNKYSINYSYHDYHEENYGLYMTPATKERTAVNEVLYDVFENKVSK